MKIKAIIGLGNPGKEYRATRHNVGFLALDAFAASQGIDVRARRLKGHIGEAEIAGSRIILARPQTYMNLSGLCVKAIMTHYSILPGDIMVLCDDFNLPRGSLRIRRSGSSGGQKGLSSIISEIGTDEFPRLRIGIGPMPAGEEAMNFVLGELSEMEKDELPVLLGRVRDALLLYLEKGIEIAMSTFNGRVPGTSDEGGGSEPAEKTSCDTMKNETAALEMYQGVEKMKPAVSLKFEERGFQEKHHIDEIGEVGN